ncbi:MAG: DUF1214 domain-containing protein [Rhizobiaceae bacterium]|nr:DUF1214 domain-containing protein [Rhizobiaceae bacterium]
MLRTILLVLVAITTAIGVGAGSVWVALESQEGVGAVTVGGWTVFPNIGTPDADPYSKARVAREGVLALGRAEGLTFIAQRDSSGARLRRDCSYLVEGTAPLARFWTIYVADTHLVVLDTTRRRPPAVHSIGLLRAADNSFAITISARPAPGNWLSLQGDGDFLIALTLYDTPVASNSGVDAVDLPQVLRGACDA